MRNKLIELAMPFVYGGVCEHQSGSCELCDCRACNARNFADHLIANGVTLQKWIPVCERLPEDGQTVLTVNSEGEMEVCFYECEWEGIFQMCGGLVKIFNITHWMPLPEPPKEEV